MDFEHASYRPNFVETGAEEGKWFLVQDDAARFQFLLREVEDLDAANAKSGS